MARARPPPRPASAKGTLALAQVDVLIPVYNAAATIEQSISSIAAQTVRDIRIIVIDDGSTDQTPALLAAMQRHEPRLEVISADHGGIVEALNAGLAACTAPFVARHDGDDISYPERFATQLAYLEAHADCIAVGANAWHIDAQGRRLGSRSHFDGDVAPDPTDFPAREPYLMHPLLMIRRSALVAASGYRNAFLSEDTDLYWRLLGQGRLHNLPDVLGEYRLVGGTLLNARISALNAQLAALSYRRRQAGLPDIDFPRDALAAYRRAETLEAIVAVGAAPLTPAERTYVEVATALKMLWFAIMRPLRLSEADHRTIAHLLESRWPELDAAGRNRARWYWWSSVARLLRRGEWRQALVLAGSTRRLAELLGYWAHGAAGRPLQRKPRP